VVGPEEMPPDAITLDSTVSHLDTATSEDDEYTPVFPRDTDIDAGKVSVMAPLGMAMPGDRGGDVSEWDVPMGRERWRVAKVSDRPGTAGHHHL
jgi:regulator of nucleoside diphosphate kinase